MTEKADSLRDELREMYRQALERAAAAEAERDALKALLAEAEEQNARLVREAEGRERADARFRKEWKSDDLFRRIDNLRRQLAGMRPYDVEDIATLQSRCKTAEDERDALKARIAGMEAEAAYRKISAAMMAEYERDEECCYQTINALIEDLAALSPAPTVKGEGQNTPEVGKPLAYFCPACQAFPREGYCRLAGCPTAPSTTVKGA